MNARQRHPSQPGAAQADHRRQGYESKANAEKGIEAIKTHAAGAAVEDHTG